MSQNKADRTRFLRDTAAVPTHPVALALWVAVWEAQTGKRVTGFGRSYVRETVTVKDGLFAGASMGKDDAAKAGIPASSTTPNEMFSYDNFSWRHWTPTAGGYQIPAGYGSMALDLLILPDMVDQPLTPATTDRRPGWAWGHTNVMVLKKDRRGPGGYSAEWTSDVPPRIPQDILNYARSMSVKEIVQNHKALLNGKESVTTASKLLKMLGR